MSTDWSIKYRPKTLSEVVGQKINIELLQERLSNPYQTMIFYGSSGCGKTTTARALANDLGAEVIELDAAANNSVDDAREILDYVARKSFTGVYKFVILDECFSADTLIENFRRSGWAVCKKPLRERKSSGKKRKKDFIRFSCDSQYFML